MFHIGCGFILTTYLFSVEAFGLSSTPSSPSHIFAEHFYHNVSITVPSSKNLVVSSLSAETALTMAYLGSCDSTQAELGSLLGIPENPTDEYLARYLTNFQAEIPKNSKLLSVNAAFVDSKYPIRADYTKTLQSVLDAKVSSVDFETDPDAAGNIINLFVQNVTNNKLKNLFAPGSLKKDVKLVLLNVLYFKANWEKQFPMRNTRWKPFTLESGSIKLVEMMHTVGMFSYTENSDFGFGVQILEMKYEKNADMSMVLLLPSKGQNITSLEQLMKKEWKMQLDSQMTVRKVDLWLPKFRISQTIELKEILRGMGVNEAFGMKADFCGISEKNDLTISRVVQKILVDVDEKGTEAAAATAIVSVRRSFHGLAGAEIVTFRADHPFLFFIRYDPTNTPVFMGRVAHPISSNELSD